MRYGLADTSAGTGHHNDFVFYDPIWICHAFPSFVCVDRRTRCATEDELVQRYRRARDGSARQFQSFGRYHQPTARTLTGPV
jgi:hypothetical protein